MLKLKYNDDEVFAYEVQYKHSLYDKSFLRLLDPEEYACCEKRIHNVLLLMTEKVHGDIHKNTQMIRP